MVSFLPLLICLGLTLCAGSPVRLFLDKGSKHTTNHAHTGLADALEEASKMFGEAAEKRLAIIHPSLKGEFIARSGSVNGRLALQGARSLLSGYFSRENGWLIKGLEPAGDTTGHGEALHEVDVLHDMVPELADKLSMVSDSNHGLALGEVALVALVIERHIIDESLSLLETSYELNGFESKDWIDEEALHEVLQSYLLLFRQGLNANRKNAVRHQALKTRAKTGSTWKALEDFEAQAAASFIWNSVPAGETGKSQYSFQDVAQIVELIALRYGQWQDIECKEMRKDLMSLDHPGSGRVPLSAFHAQPMNEVYGYKFTESAEYLRHVGALEESVGAEPQVLTVNYVNGPSNCIATSRYFSVCCLNGCATMTNSLVTKLAAPMPKTDTILTATKAFAWPRKDGKGSAHELHALADNNGGRVPLFGANFAQWMHHAFPNVCPFPRVSELSNDQATPLTSSSPSQWPDADECTRLPVYTV